MMFDRSRATRLLACLSLAIPYSFLANAASGTDSDKSPQLSTDAQKFGYSIGFELGQKLSNIKDDVDEQALEKGIREGVAGKSPRLNDEQREQIKSIVAGRIQEKEKAERLAAAQKNKDVGDSFLAENAKKPGVKTTASGLEYEVLTEGQGDHPKASDKVTVNYKGTLLDGTVFDSSYDRGQPVSFQLAQVIPGWTEGVQLMTPGSKYKFYLPAALAYGERGSPPTIAPNSTLVFEVELVSIDSSASASTPAPSNTN